jgi:hypothetical protein
MKIDFKIDEIVFVFLQFEGNKSREEFDLALYTDFKISTS